MSKRTKVIKVVPVIIWCLLLSANSFSAEVQEQLDALLPKIAGYEFGQSSEPLTKLTDLVRDAYGKGEQLEQVERRFIAFLGSDATWAGKQFICRKLSVMGSERSVPALAAMLTDAKTSDMARYALERIPGGAVDQALLDALDKSAGKVKTGIISTLGERRFGEAVEELSVLVGGRDQEVGEAAAAALGKIGGKDAAEALKKSLRRSRGDLRSAVSGAYLMCADRFLAEGKKSPAMQIYEQMYASDEPSLNRIAALRGIVSADKKKGTKLVVDVLKGKDRRMQAIAIGLVREVPGKEILKEAVSQLGSLGASGQVQLLSALADRGDKGVLPDVKKAVKSEDESVRIAALGALSSLGDASCIDLLAEKASEARGAEQEAARESLYRLRGRDVDSRIISKISSASAAVKVELIRSAGPRNMKSAVATLLETARDTDSRVRLESVKALREVAGAEQMSKLVSMLISLKSDAERREAERTLAAVAEKITDKDQRADAVLAALPSVKDVAAKSSLLNVLGMIGAKKGLVELRSALQDSDTTVQTAAIRALSLWPDAEPAGDLVKIARGSTNQVHKVLALRGYVRLIGLESDRPASETLRMYKEAMSLAPRADEKKMVFSGLSNVRTIESLNMAAEYLDDTALRTEAESAIVKIADDTRRSNPERTKAVLQKVVEGTRSNSVRRQAEGLLRRIR